MTDAYQYFLASRRDVTMLDCVEISHPSFTQVYRKVRNNTDGVEVILENFEIAFFEYYPMQISELSDSADLDFGIRIDFGDLGEILPKELDAVYSADNMGVKPTVIYRGYRSDNEFAPTLGPWKLEVTAFSFKQTGASFEAHAPYVNKNKTGQMYNLTRFPMLRGFLK